MQIVQKNQSDKQQTSLDGISEAKIGLKEMKENYSNKLIVGHLNGKGVIRPHLVEMDHHKNLEPLKGAPDLNHFLHKKNIFSNFSYMKKSSKNNEVYQFSLVERAVRPPGKRGNVTLIHPMRYKPQIFTDEVL